VRLGARGCRGAALLSVVVVLMLVGGLVAAMFWVGVAERRAGRATVSLQRALGLAEGAAVAALSGWDVSRYNAMPVGTAVDDPPGPAGATVRIRRLSESLFLIVASGAEGQAVQTVGVLARLHPQGELPAVPLLATGPVAIGQGAGVLEPQADSGKAGCTSPRSGGDDPRFIDGRHRAGERLDFAEWVARSTKVVPPGRYAAPGPSRDGTRCRTEDPVNWGDPRGGAACRDYQPVVRVPGDLTVVGGAGQGVLLVDGDLRVRGTFMFEGLVLVGGSVVVGGGASRFVGALHAGALRESGVELGGRAAVVYSRCSLERAALAAAKPRPLAGQAWIYAIE